VLTCLAVLRPEKLKVSRQGIVAAATVVLFRFGLDRAHSAYDAIQIMIVCTKVFKKNT
jgi:uncharacterized membrane protein